MIITDKFIFIHIPKNAGSTFSDIITRTSGLNILYQEQHGIEDWIPDKWKHLPKVFIIRKPTTWYWSLWQYSKEKGYCPPFIKYLMQKTSNNYRLSFVETMDRLHFEPWTGDILEENSKYMEILSKWLLSKKEVGLYTHIYRSMINNYKDYTVLKVETFNTDVTRYLSKFIDVTDLKIIPRNMTSKEFKIEIPSRKVLELDRQIYREFYDDVVE